MPLFVWKSDYSVDVELLDQHHQKLFSLLNALYETTMQSKETGHVLPIINELREYTEYHFLAEEQYMQDIGYVETAEHIVKHRDFTRKIENLNLQHRDDDLAVTRELIVVLGNWLLHHVLEEDRKYSKWRKGDNI